MRKMTTMRRSNTIPTLCLAGLLLAPCGAFAQQFVSAYTPTQKLGSHPAYKIIAVQCNVSEWGTPLTAPSYFTAKETSAGYLSQITPSSFCLRCSSNPTSNQTVWAAVTIPPGKGTYQANLLIQNVNDLNAQGVCAWLFTSLGAVGINDSVQFTGDPKYYNPVVFSPVKGGLPLPVPKPFNPVQFAARFVDQPPASSAVAWTWSIDLDFVGGSYKLPVGGSLGSGYVIGAPFSLPDSEWVRDANGNILTKVRVTVKDSDGIFHTAVLIAGIEAPPNKPRLAARMVCSSTVELAYEAGAGTSFEAHYGPAAGPPYVGIGADQGSSPIQVGAAQLLRLSGLAAGSYAFSVRASNQHGNSAFADPVLIPADREMHGQALFQAGNVSLFEALGTIAAPVGGTFEVEQGAAVQIRAGRSIILHPGFRAASGSTFSATIARCP
jgi:hypothetical protein